VESFAGGDLCSYNPSHPPRSVGRSRPPSPQVVRTDEPYEWLSAIIALYILVAVAAVIGGFAEAGNHSHRVVHAGEFGIGRSVSDNRDYNYAYVGIAAGVFWMSLAILMALVRSIARDVRRSPMPPLDRTRRAGRRPLHRRNELRASCSDGGLLQGELHVFRSPRKHRLESGTRRPWYRDRRGGEDGHPCSRRPASSSCTPPPSCSSWRSAGGTGPGAGEVVGIRRRRRHCPSMRPTRGRRFWSSTSAARCGGPGCTGFRRVRACSTPSAGPVPAGGPTWMRSTWRRA
jgi:hypothetical protein